jgi:LITAF-like zinc ribbon domain
MDGEPENAGYVCAIMLDNGIDFCRIIYCLTCLVCCPLLLCLPCILKGEKSHVHFCGNCRSKVAIRKPDGKVEIMKPLPVGLVPSKYAAPVPAQQ